MTEDRYPTIAEVAAMMAEWLPEIYSLEIHFSAGVPYAVFTLPAVSGIRIPLLWVASRPGVVQSSEDCSEDEWKDTREAWTRLYAHRSTRPEAVWRWRRTEPSEVPEG